LPERGEGLTGSPPGSPIPRSCTGGNPLPTPLLGSVCQTQDLFALGRPIVPEPVVLFPEGVRLTASGVRRLAWYRDFLNAIAAGSTGGGLDSLPRRQDVDEPCRVIGQREGAWRLPLAALVICRLDGIEAAIGAWNTIPTGPATTGTKPSRS
jgi:hypothetical protein